MKRLLLLITLLVSFFVASAQIDSDVLRKAIGYYQQLEFEKSIELFDQLVESNPGDASIQGRRGFVICEFLKAIDNNLVNGVEETVYNEYLEKGIKDLELSLNEYPNNADNKTALAYLKEKR
jgi:tetratricopeptide (TPR) repeat protein